ncbi:hypothetical protein QO015_000299 [Kaistia geumhonensis]|uniref:Polysaccharide pyruvyl transferase domain-containing protein n=2 Tax=Kaistia geumhonensis TaxID=410839 RepID=A0ABU0M169_9HYPH|nr:hypothetical protein [Kaistia geumhonensis]
MQAYGLRQWLITRGHDAQFINYHPSYVEEGGEFSRIWDPRRAKVNAKIAYLKLSTLQRRLFGNKEQARAFERFRQDALGITGKRLHTKAEVDAMLASQAKPFDVISVGSDQIWNPSQQYGLDPVYFADLAVKPGTRRISYAASFGKNSIDPQFEPQVRTLIRSLDGISAREESGAEIARRLSGREVTCVPDPTLLLGDFEPLIAKSEPIEKERTFCYTLRTGQGIREVADQVSKILGAEVVSPYNVHRRWAEIGRTIYPSPYGWLATIKASRFVLTNSFHGTVFAILMRKPFLVVGLPGTKKSLNERALNLLGLVGLEHRFVTGDQQDVVARLVGTEIDWAPVEQRLAALQATGAGFLEAQLALAAQSGAGSAVSR